MHKLGLLILGTQGTIYPTKKHAQQFEVISDFDVIIPVRRKAVVTDKRGVKKPVFDQFIIATVVEDSDWKEKTHTAIINNYRDVWNENQSFQIPADMPLVWEKGQSNKYWEWLKSKMENYKVL